MVKMKSSESKKSIEKTGVLIVVLISIAVLLVMLMSFYQKISSITRAKNMILIEEQSDSIINILQNEIKGSVKILWRAEKFINEQSKIYSEEISEALNDIKNSAVFDEIGILDSYGKIYTSEREEKKFIYGEYFNDLGQDRQNKYVYRKNEYISDIFVDIEDNKEKLMIIVPIEINGKHEYCIYGKYNLKNIVEKLSLSKETEKQFKIIDNDGNYVYSSDNKNIFLKDNNLWNELKKYEFDDKYGINEIQENIKNGKKGEFYFEYRNEGRYVSYKPIGINNWYILSIQTEYSMNYYTREVWKEVLKLLFGIIIILTILISTIVNYIIKSKKILTQKDEQLSIQNNIFNLVLNRSNNVPFEVDLLEKVLILYIKNKKGKNYIHKVSLETLKPCNILQSGVIKEDGYKDYESVYKKILNAKEIKSEIINMKIYDEFHWIRVETIIISKNDNTKYIVGIFENYNDQMDKEEKIKNHIKEMNIMDLKSKTDYLTSIFNRKGFVQEINYYLSLEREESSNDIFLIFDLDNFKTVNDLLGHQTGDRVLIETANIIKNNLSKKDIVGRLAGDEFVAYLRNIESKRDLESIARRLNKLLNRVVEKNGINIKISASIGMAIVEKKDEKFEDLYEKADKALYDVKYNCKNGYKIYDKYEKRLYEDEF